MTLSSIGDVGRAGILLLPDGALLLGVGNPQAVSVKVTPANAMRSRRILLLSLLKFNLLKPPERWWPRGRAEAGTRYRESGPSSRVRSRRAFPGCNGTRGP